MTEWHWRWQQSVPPDRREVVMGKHRADIVTASGGVVEVQHSPISSEGIEAREAFYGDRMAWIFDATAPFAAGRIDVESRRGEWDHIWWKHARRSLEACRRPVLLDLGNGIVLHLASAILVEAYSQRWWRPVLNMEGRGWCRPLTRQSVEAWLAVGGRWDVQRVPEAHGYKSRGCSCGGCPAALNDAPPPPMVERLT